MSRPASVMSLDAPSILASLKMYLELTKARLSGLVLLTTAASLAEV